MAGFALGTVFTGHVVSIAAAAGFGSRKTTVYLMEDFKGRPVRTRHTLHRGQCLDHASSASTRSSGLCFAVQGIYIFFVWDEAVELLSGSARLPNIFVFPFFLCCSTNDDEKNNQTSNLFVYTSTKYACRRSPRGK